MKTVADSVRRQRQYEAERTLQTYYIQILLENEGKYNK